MRIVGEFDRRGQDELVEGIVALFGDGNRAPKVVDRRAEPMHWYRAVHVIVFPEGAPVEIQVRTGWQHEWAEFVAPDDPELNGYRHAVEGALGHLRQRLHDIDDVDKAVETLWP